MRPDHHDLTFYHGGGAYHGRCSVPRSDRGTPTTPLFSARDAAERSACEAHADARRRDATLARNAVAGRRPSSASNRLFLYLLLPNRSIRIFRADEASAPGDADLAASASVCGGRGARHRGVIRHRREKEDGEVET